MRFLPLLLLGSVWASPIPAEPSSNLDDLSAPGVNWIDPDFEAHLLRARATTTTQPKISINVTQYRIKLKGDGGWTTFEPNLFGVDGDLFVTTGIPSPGTKNGDNPVDLYLRAGIPYTAGPYNYGDTLFVTNPYLFGLPNALGGANAVNADYARVTVNPTSGIIMAYVDFANIPYRKQQNVFNSKRYSPPGSPYYPNLNYYANDKSWFGFQPIGDKGDIKGSVWLEGNGGPIPGTPEAWYCRYVGTVTGYVVSKRTYTI